MNPKLLAALKTAAVLAVSTVVNAIAHGGIPSDRQSWLTLIGTVATAEWALWTHSPITAINNAPSADPVPK